MQRVGKQVTEEGEVPGTWIPGGKGHLWQHSDCKESSPVHCWAVLSRAVHQKQLCCMMNPPLGLALW